MKRTLRIRTIVEKHELVVIRSPIRPNKAFCLECAEPVALVALDQAVMISGTSSRAIYRLIEKEQIHFMETPTGGVLICPATLLRRVCKQGPGELRRF